MSSRYQICKCDIIVRIGSQGILSQQSLSPAVARLVIEGKERQ
jgi:hypothetical protein